MYLLIDRKELSDEGPNSWFAHGGAGGHRTAVDGGNAGDGAVAGPGREGTRRNGGARPEELDPAAHLVGCPGRVRRHNEQVRAGYAFRTARGVRRTQDR